GLMWRQHWAQIAQGVCSVGPERVMPITAYYAVSRTRNTFGASGYFNTVSVTTPDDIPGAPRATYRRPEQTIRKTRADLDRRFQQRDELVTARSTACDFASSLLTVMSVLTPHATVMGL